MWRCVLPAVQSVNFVLEPSREHYAHLVMETQKELSSLGGQIGETGEGGEDNASFTPTVVCSALGWKLLCAAGVALHCIALADPVIASKSQLPC